MTNEPAIEHWFDEIASNDSKTFLANLFSCHERFLDFRFCDLEDETFSYDDSHYSFRLITYF